MKKTTALFSALLTGVLMLTACADPNQFSGGEVLSDGQKHNTDAAVTYNYKDGAAEPPQSYNNYSGSVTEVSLRLLRERYNGQSDSPFVFAPASSAVIICQLANAASSDARADILLGLGAELTADDLSQCSSYFKSRMQEVSQTGREKSADGEEQSPFDAAHVCLQNSLFVRDGNEVTTAFLQNNADYYQSTVIRSDFAADNFITKQQSLFRDYVNRAQIGADKNDLMYTVTAASISDTWLVPYTAQSLGEGTFHGAKGDAKVQFMTSDESYVHTHKAEGIIKYTAKNPLKLLMLKPTGKRTLKELLDTLNYSEYSNLVGSVNIKETAQATLPQFSLNSGNQARPLSASLQKAGFRTLFAEDTKFKAMNISGKLHLNEMYELEPSLTLSANGIGDRAEDKLVTDKNALTPNAGTTPFKSKHKLTFDSPFVFMLIDNESNIPVYAGVYQ